MNESDHKMIIENLVGKRLGRLVVTGEQKTSGKNYISDDIALQWPKKSVRVDPARSGRTVSCSCLELMKQRTEDMERQRARPLPDSEKHD